MDNENPELRTIILSPDTINDNKSFANNTIKTAKYNIYTFLPFALLYQFTNYFNVYFLIVTIILSIEEITGMNWTIGVIPYLVVLGLSLIREGIENYKKWKYDDKYNNSKTIKYNESSQSFEEVQWMNLRVGNIIKICKNESIPADVLIIKSSNANGIGYLETTNLDGENALKPREAITYLSSQINSSTSQESLIQFNFLSKRTIIQLDHPNKNIYQIDGFIQESTDTTNNQIFFTINNILLRGGTLKNAEFVYGIIIYCGKETKLMQNINNFRYKQSSIERTVNVIVLYVIGLTFLICIIGAIVGNHNEKVMHDTGTFYLFKMNEFDRITIGLNGLKYFGTYFAIFNNIIPICLMIALETVKGIQVIYMSFDGKLFEGANDQLKILSFRLHEDLGNVKYIFSDKTGTLTKNEMIFKACSIYNRLYDNRKVDRNKEQTNTARGTFDGNYNNVNKIKSFFDEDFDKESLMASFYDTSPLIRRASEGPIKTIVDSTLYFFLNIVLNHGVLTEKATSSSSDSNPNIERIFQGTNPDELTLVQAANELGIQYIGRIGNIITLMIFNHEVKYEVIHWFEFTSERLRSSILVKEISPNQEDDFLLFMKGADSVILTNRTLDDFSNENLYSMTKVHIDDFAKEGLRTLCFCMKVIDQRSLEEFNRQYNQLKESAVKDKTQGSKVEQLISDLEQDMTLLGVTSLEDKLQDNLKDDIQEFIEAGIHVWMLTGDKMDTAESIAYSCKLFNNDTEVFKIKADNQIQLNKLLITVLNQMKEIEDELNHKSEELKKKKYKSITKELKFSPKTIKQEDLIKYIANEFEKDKLIKKQGRIGNNDNGIEIENNRKQGQNHNYHDKNTNHSYDKEQKNISIQKIPFKPRPISSHLKKIITEARNYHNNQSNPRKVKEDDHLNDREIMEFICNKKFLISENDEDHNNNKHLPNSNPDNEDGNSINSVIQDIIKTDLKLQNDYNPSENQDIQISSIINQQHHFSPNYPTRHHILSSNKLICNNSQDTPVEKFRKNICKKLHKIEQQKRINNFNFLHSNNPSHIDTPNNIINDSLKNFGLIIEGISITKCMEKSVEDIFMSIIKKCRSVVCSRCAPIQKSDMIAFVKRKTHLSEGITLAIGDGGNDVNMIKEAEIGIGLFGKEGYQAAFNSDYAISKFKYLKRLIFYHGRYFLMRNSYFIYYFFYKSAIYTMIHFWFLFDNMCSSSIIYDESMFLIYNAVGSNIIVAIRTVLEQDIDMDFEGYPKQNEIKKLIPDIYREYRNEQPFSYLRFAIIFCLSLLQSMIIYYFPKFALLNTMITTEGIMPDYWTYSLISYSLVIISQTMVNIVDSFLYRPFSFFAYFLHIFFNMITIIINNYNAWDQCGGITMILANQPIFWLIMLVTFGIGYFPYLFYSRFDMFFVYDIINGLRFGKYEFDIDKKVYLRKLEKINKLKRLIMKFKKIYSDNNYKVDNVRDKQMKEMVEKYKKLKRQLKKEGNEDKDKEGDTDRIFNPEIDINDRVLCNADIIAIEAMNKNINEDVHNNNNVLNERRRNLFHNTNNDKTDPTGIMSQSNK